MHHGWCMTSSEWHRRNRPPQRCFGQILTKTSLRKRAHEDRRACVEGVVDEYWGVLFSCQDEKLPVGTCADLKANPPTSESERYVLPFCFMQETVGALLPECVPRLPQAIGPPVAILQKPLPGSSNYLMRVWISCESEFLGSSKRKSPQREVKSISTRSVCNARHKLRNRDSTVA